MDISYSRLYLRMVLYIGAALVAFSLIGAVSVFLIASYELRGYVAARQSPLAREAAAELARGGRPALEAWLGERGVTQPDVTIYVLDERSRDLLGRPLPATLAGFVRDSVVAGPRELDLATVFGMGFPPFHGGLMRYADLAWSE